MTTESCLINTESSRKHCSPTPRWCKLRLKKILFNSHFNKNITNISRRTSSGSCGGPWTTVWEPISLYFQTHRFDPCLRVLEQGTDPPAGSRGRCIVDTKTGSCQSKVGGSIPKYPHHHCLGAAEQGTEVWRYMNSVRIRRLSANWIIKSSSSSSSLTNLI